MEAAVRARPPCRLVAAGDAPGPGVDGLAVGVGVGVGTGDGDGVGSGEQPLAEPTGGVYAVGGVAVTPNSIG